MKETENQRLKFFRLLKDYTQKEFAELANIKQGSYADQERGKVKVSGDVKLALFKEFSLNIDWLETGEGEMLVPDKDEVIDNLQHRINELESTSSVMLANDSGEGYSSGINWQKKFIEVDEKYKALLENRLMEFLKRGRHSSGSA